MFSRFLILASLFLVTTLRAADTVVICVTDTLKAKVESKINRLRDDIIAEGDYPRVLIATVPLGSNKLTVWNTLSALNTTADPVKGVLLLGDIPLGDGKIASTTTVTDLIYGDLTQYNPDVKQYIGLEPNKFNWIGRISAAKFYSDRGYSEEAQISKYLDTNHGFRTGAIRVPHRMFKLGIMGDLLPAEIDNFDQFGVEFVPYDTNDYYQIPTDDILLTNPDNTFRAVHGGSLYLEAYAHGGQGAIVGVQGFEVGQLIVYGGNNCNAGVIGGAVNQHLLHPASLMLLGWSGAVPIGTRFPEMSRRAGVGAHLQAGRSYGKAHALISSPLTSGQVLVHGDPSLRMFYAPSNQIPNVTAQSIPATAMVGVSFPLSVTASDADGTVQSYEWWMTGYSTGTYGQGSSKVTTTPATTFRYSAPFTGKIWVMAKDQYGARSFTQQQITVAANPNQVSIAVTQSLAKESGLAPAVFTVTRVGDTSQPLNLPYSLGGTATAADHNGGTGGIVSFAANQSSATLTITPVNDTTQEGYETLTVTLADGEGYMVKAGGNSATARIQDDESDNPPLLERVWPKVSEVQLTLGTDLWVEMLVLDDGATAPTLTWSQVSGPTGTTLESPSQSGTRVSFTQPGNYSLRFTARDSANQSTSLDVSVAVSAPSAGTTADLLVWLPADEGSATTLRDAGPLGKNGYLTLSTNKSLPTQGPTWSTRAGGASLEFNGSRDLAITASTVVFDTTKGLSASAWVRLDRAAGGAAKFNGAVGLEGASNSVGGIFEVDDTTYQLSSRFNNNRAVVHKAQTLPQSEWVHVVWTREPSASGSSAVVRLYMNGELGSTGTDTLTSQTKKLKIGGDFVSGDNFWRGGIDDVRLYNRTLTAEEVAALYTPGTNRAPRLSVSTATATPLNTSLALNGSVTDDGLPAGSALTQNWSLLSGPAQPTFTDSALPASSVSLSSAGSYTLRLTADDGEVRVVGDKKILAYTTAPANTAPVVSAGSDVATAVGTQVFLAGSASDDGLGNPHGTLALTWSKVSGPGEVHFATATASTQASFTAPGAYVLKLLASDGVLSVEDTVTVTVSAAAVNTAPVVTMADTARLLRNPVSGVVYNPTYTVADDGLPAGSSLTHTWSIAQHGSSFTSRCVLTNATTANPTFTFSSSSDPSNVDQFYIFRVAVSDGQFITTKDISVYLDNATNAAPTVSAGADASVLIPNTVNLSGTASDDGYPTASLTTTWSQVSGPGTTTFGSTSAKATTASFSAAGTYVLRLTASDSSLAATDDVTITVAAPGADAPVVSTITSSAALPLKAASTALTASATDDDGSAGLVTTWSVVSAPAGGSATFSPNGTNAASTSTATFNKAGTWRVRATVQDAGGANAWRELELQVVRTTSSITVSPATATVRAGRNQTFTATATDQFGAAITDHPGFIWSLDAGSPGSCTQSGFYSTLATDIGPATVRVFDADANGTASVTIVNNLAPLIHEIVVSPGNELSDRLGSFAALVEDDGPDGSLSYAWSVVSGPAGTVWDASNNSTQGFNLNAYFPATGSYTVRLVITDNFGLSASLDTTVSTDVRTPTSIVLSPATVTVQPNGTRQFTATVLDQTNQPLSPQPTLTWSATGAGTVNNSGFFTAGGSNGSATVTATALGLTGNATITVTNTAPTVSITSPTAVAIKLPDRTDSLVLTATAADAEVSPSVTWSQVSGPGTATFANAASLNTSATFPTDGQYVLRITVSDGLLTATDEITITVGGAALPTPVFSTNFSTGVTSPNPDSLRFSGDNLDKAIAFTGGGSNAASPMWAVTDSSLADLKSINALNLGGFTWGQASDPIRYGGIFTTGSDFGYVIASTNANIRYTGTGATQPLVQFGAAGVNSGSFNLVFEVKPGKTLSSLAVKYKAGTASTSGVWNGGATAAENGNYNVSIHPVDGSGNVATGFNFYPTAQALGTGAGVSVNAVDQTAASLGEGTYLLRVSFFNKTKGERYSLDDLSLEASSGAANAAPQVAPGAAPNASVGVAANLTGTAIDDGLPSGSTLTTTWSQVSGPGTATFGNANAANTTVTFSAAGNYVLRLTATDGSATVFEDLAVTATSSNTAPTIGAISDQTIAANAATTALAFTVGDTETAAASLTLNGTSSNTSLVPNANITFGGSGANRTVTVTPAANQSGTATITLTVSDGSLSANSTFTLTVTETLASWIGNYPGVGSLTAATEDADADGLANLVEYALGTDPSDPSDRSDLTVGTSGDRLTLTFTPQRVTGLTYTVQASSDLVTWTDTVLTGLTPGTLYTHTDSTILGGGAAKRFLRLKVSTP